MKDIFPVFTKEGARGSSMKRKYQEEEYGRF
jgi:hypothetical protein